MLIEVHPRLHLGLISMHAGGPRRNGGVGFALEGPTVLVGIERSEKFEVRDNRPVALTQAERDLVITTLTVVRDRERMPFPVTISIDGGMPTHSGLGSGTAIRLAAIEGLFLANGFDTDREKLVVASGRGGTSGIGITSYFEGGLILDLGVAAREPADFLPSSSLVPSALPLTLSRVRLPDWNVGVCLPLHLQPKSQAEEVAFFRRSLPLTAEDSYRSAYGAIFGVVAAAMEGDYAPFCTAVDAMQMTRWKQLERGEYGQELVRIDKALRIHGADAVGMSSLGPALFFLGSDSCMENVAAAAAGMSCRVTITRAWNKGRSLRG